MPRQTRRQEGTGPINPQMQYIEEQQFISQEVPGKAAQQTSEFKTIFGKDSPTAFATQPSPMQNLMGIVGATYQGIDAAGKTFQTSVDIDRGKDAREARRLQEEMGVIDSDPKLTPVQKQQAKFDLQVKGFETALRPETKNYYRASQDITMHNVEFLDDAENFANTLLVFNKKALRMTPAERLEQIPVMFRALEERYPGFSGKIREQARTAELKTHELIWKENAGKTVGAWNIALAEALSTPSLQDPNRLHAMSPEALFNMTAGIMAKNKDTSSFMENMEDDSALRDILMTKTNEALFTNQANSRNREKNGRLVATARAISMGAPTGNFGAIWGAMEYGGIGVLSQLMTTQAEPKLGTGFGKNLQGFRDMLLRAPDADVLLKFYELANPQRLGLEDAEERFGSDSEMANLKSAFELADSLRERRDNGKVITLDDVMELRDPVSFMIQTELEEAYDLTKGEKDAGNTFALQALQAYTTDHGPLDGTRKHLRAKDKDADNNKTASDPNKNSREFYLTRSANATNWDTTSNNLEVGIHSAISVLAGERDILNNQLNFWGRTSAAAISIDIKALGDAYSELNYIKRLPDPMQVQQNDRKNELVETVFGITDRYDLVIPKPVSTTASDMDDLEDLDYSVSSWNATNQSFIEGHPHVVNALRDAKRLEVANLFDGIGEELRRGFDAIEEVVPDQIEEGIRETLEAFDELMADPATTGEVIVDSGMNLLQTLEMHWADEEKKPKHEFPAWSQWQGSLGTIKKMLVGAINRLSPEGEFGVATNTSTSDPMIASPNPNNNVQWARAFNRILPIAASGGVNSVMENPWSKNKSIKFLATGLEGIGETFLENFNADTKRSPEERIAQGLAALTPDQQKILGQYHKVAGDPLMSYQIPQRLREAMRDNFIIPLLNTQTRGEYQRLRGNARAPETGSIAAQTILMLDQALPVLSNYKTEPDKGIDGPRDAARAAQSLNMVLSRFNQRGSYIDAVQEVTYENSGPIFDGLQAALKRQRSAAYTTPDGRISIIPPNEVPLNELWGLMLTGEITNVDKEALEGLIDTPALDWAILSALYESNDQLQISAAQLGWRRSIFEETFGPLRGTFTGTQPDRDLQYRGYSAQGQQLAAGLNAGEQLIISVAPTGSLNTGGSLGRINGQWVDKSGNPITDAATVRALLDKDMASADPNWEIIVHKTGTPNITNSSTSETPANISVVAQIDLEKLYISNPNDSMVPLPEQRDMAAKAQTPVPPSAIPAIVQHMVSNPLSNLRKAADVTGLEHTIYGDGFTMLLKAYEDSVSTASIPDENNKPISVAVSGNLTRTTEKNADGENLNRSNQRYGRSAADVTLFSHGYAIVNHEIGNILIEHSDLPPEELAQMVDKKLGELAQQLGTKGGKIVTFRAGDRSLDFIGNDTRKDYPYDFALIDSINSVAYADSNYTNLSVYPLAPEDSESERLIYSTKPHKRKNFYRPKSGAEVSSESIENLTLLTDVPSSDDDSFVSGLVNTRASAISRESKTRKQLSWAIPASPLKAWLKYKWSGQGFRDRWARSVKSNSGKPISN